MGHRLFAVAAVIGIVSWACAGESPRDYGSPPRLLIGSCIDADGNLVVSATEQRKKKVPRVIENIYSGY